MKVLKRLCVILLFFSIAISVSATKKKVACVGNSITENYALDMSDKYPSQLQQLLGDRYEIRNYGIGARTLLKKGDYPYWNEQRYIEVLEWEPDIVVIKMGTNDAKPKNWQYKSEFESNYIEFVNSFKALASKPKIYICYPIPTFEGNSLPVSDTTITNEIIPIIESVAKKTKSQIIDLHSPLLSKDDFVYDKVHPNKRGTTSMARIVAKAICPKRKFPKAAGQRVNIVFVGNSITEGSDTQCPPPMATAIYLDSLGYDLSYINCGRSGHTTYDFLPSSKAYKELVLATDSLYKNGGLLLFSIKLGTNDSAIEGTNGAPVSSEQYESNMQVILDSLHIAYPQSAIILHNPIWYSPNTYNSAKYLQEGLDRLKTYSTVIDRLSRKNSSFTFVGDKSGFNIFRKKYKEYHIPQQGNEGVFYLHPNLTGARVLGNLWGKSLDKCIKTINKKTLHYKSEQ